MKIVLVAGARPNFMKIAPLLKAIAEHNELNKPNKPNELKEREIVPILVHTGQHYDYEMSQVFFEELKLPQPDVHLGIGSGTHAEQTGKIMIELEKVLFAQKPDLVLVVGDVNSTLAAALAAVKLHIPVAHVEAGLRSYDQTMPEEINRLLTDHISDYLFTTSKYDDDNLRKEGIPEDKIYRVGNIMADSLLDSREIARKSDIPSRLGLKEQSYAVLTLHRPSNVDEKASLFRIIDTIMQIAHKILIVFPAHPRTQKRLKEFGILNNLPVTSRQLLITEPLGYLSFLNLEMNARMVITDSGGMQVETTILSIPCLTMLDHPVWPITHEQGTNILVGSDCQKLKEEAFKVLNGKWKKGSIPELWDGKTAERIVEKLASDKHN
jgi:UDP-N-acetylglucosamine 2-epimerase (non-hydrolysing)